MRTSTVCTFRESTPTILTVHANFFVSDSQDRRGRRCDKLRDDVLAHHSFWVVRLVLRLTDGEHLLDCMFGATWRGHLGQNGYGNCGCCVVNVVMCHQARHVDTMQEGRGDVVCKAAGLPMHSAKWLLRCDCKFFWTRAPKSCTSTVVPSY